MRLGDGYNLYKCIEHGICIGGYMEAQNGTCVSSASCLTLLSFQRV